MKKRVLLLIIVCVAFTGLVSCGEQNELVKENAQVVADAFTNGDMATINKIIFATNKLEVDKELSDIWGEDAQSQDGVLTYIFDLVTVEVKEITDSTIEYEIEVPDMSNVFVDIDTNAVNMSQDELLQYIKNYAQNAETKDTTVALEYILVDDEPVVNYQNEEFINAVTSKLSGLAPLANSSIQISTGTGNAPPYFLASRINTWKSCVYSIPTTKLKDLSSSGTHKNSAVLVF